MADERPIGIFDSGIGGLTLAAAINQLLPNESLIYFGDTAHLPYGDKSAKAIIDYSLQISEFLISQNCKLILIACNTASAHAYNEVYKKYGKIVPVIGVIEPVVKFVSTQYQSEKIGVIATKGTIASGVYEKRLKQLQAKLQVASLATPLLAAMIEEGFYNHSVSSVLIENYLSAPTLQSIDALILACTHYPLIKNEIASFFNGKVHIIDTAEIVAKEVALVLDKENMLSPLKDKGKHRFFVSDYTESFEKSTKIFFKDAVHLEHKKLSS